MGQQNTILYLVNNNDACLDAMTPVVAALRQRSPGLRHCALSVTEYFNNYATRPDLLEPHFDAWTSLATRLRAHLPDLHRDQTRAESVLWLHRETITKKTQEDFCALVESLGVVAIVMVNDRFFPEKPLIDRAKELGIPTLLIQESVRKDEGFKNAEVLHGQGGCDAIAAWGGNGVDYFTRVGVPSERIHVTGSPRVDLMRAQAMNMDPAALRQGFGLAPDTAVVLLASNHIARLGHATFDDFMITLMRVTAQANDLSEQLGGLHMLVKPHRQEVVDFQSARFVEYMDRLPHVTYIPDTSLPEAIMASNAVLVFNSTVAVEAALLGRPVGLMNYHHWDLVCDFAERGVAETISTEIRMRAFLLHTFFAMIPDQGQIDRSAYYVSHQGEAADRVATLLLSLIEMPGH